MYQLSFPYISSSYKNDIKINTLPVQKKRRPPFALITECICCGIVSTTSSNVTTFISIQSCINFWPRLCIDDRRVEPFLQSFPAIPNTFNVVKVRTLWWPIHVKMTPHVP